MAKRYWIIGFFLSIFFFGQILEVQAQKKIRYFWQGFGKNAEEYDDDIKIKIGIFISGVSLNYAIDKGKDWYLEGVPTNTDPTVTNNPDIGIFTSIVANRGIALNLGIPLDYTINEYFNLTLSPGFTIFSRHSLEFNGTG